MWYIVSTSRLILICGSLCSRISQVGISECLTPFQKTIQQPILFSPEGAIQGLINIVIIHFSLMYIHIYIYTYIHISIYPYIHIHIYMYIYVYINPIYVYFTMRNGISNT